MAPSHPREEQPCSCQVLQTTKADQMGAILVEMCNELGQLFFPSVTEQGRGNALWIHTRTQTTDSLLWRSSVLITTRFLLLGAPGLCFSASHSTEPKAQVASSPCSKDCPWQGGLWRAAFIWSRFHTPFWLGGEGIESSPEERDSGVSGDEKEPSQWLQGEWTLVSVVLELQKHLLPAQWFSFKSSFNGSSSINAGGFENPTLKILCVLAAAAWPAEKAWGSSPVAFPHLLWALRLLPGLSLAGWQRM